MSDSPTKVLLVEDDADEAERLGSALQASEGTQFVLERVSTLHDALECLSTRSFDAVLLDLSLPDAQGLEGLTRLVAAVPHLPIVVLTAAVDDALGMRAVQAGAQDCFVKRDVGGRLLTHCLHYAIERTRFRQEMTEEAALSTALAWVGEELISSLSTPVLVDRLCRLTTEVLGCDYTHTWLWNEAEQAYLRVASYGDPPEGWETPPAFRVPREAVMGLFAALEGRDVMQSVMDQPDDFLPERLAPERHGIPAILYMVIRRGGEVIGGQACGYRGGPRRFTPRQERLAERLLHLASFAFENARLVEELEQSNLIKTYFAATMSHELRGTINTMLLCSESALAELPDNVPSEIQDALELLRDQARESADLINATLEMHGLEAGHAQQEEQEISVTDLMNAIAQEISRTWTQPGPHLVWQVLPALPPVCTHPIKLKMILKNLITNAIKYTEHGTVGIDVRVDGDGILFSVSDTGIGIPREELSSIFEPFRQAHGVRSRRAGGTGLGLYIVRRLVDTLGGTIRADSELDRGSTFRVWIPLKVVTPRPPTILLERSWHVAPHRARRANHPAQRTEGTAQAKTKTD
jgi:signal transduction histidine kinase/DNA-binding NarL/FixJ family response regulator